MKNENHAEVDTLEVVSAAKMANILGVTPRWLRMLTEEGYAVRTERGQYLLSGTVQGALRRSAEDRKSGSRLVAENRLRDARAAEIELRVATRRRELIPLSDAEASMGALCGIIRETLDGFPARITRDRGLRAQIERETEDALHHIADRAEAIGEALEAGRDVL